MRGDYLDQSEVSVHLLLLEVGEDGLDAELSQSPLEEGVAVI